MGTGESDPVTMVRIHPFAALHADPAYAPGVAAVPYDVVSAAEAADVIRANPRSFLRVSRADAELPGVPPHDPAVYQRARRNLEDMVADGLLVRDSGPALYLYRVREGNTEYTGLCACVETRDYEENRIRRHEATRYDKEEDRTRHIDVTGTHNGPVVLLCPDRDGVLATAEEVAERVPLCEAASPQGGTHQIFAIRDPASIQHLAGLLSGIPALYIADGHHRAKSAVNVAALHRGRGRETGGSSQFLAVIFPHNRVAIHGYSRLLADLGGHSPDVFLSQVRREFRVTAYGTVDRRAFTIPPLSGNARNETVFHLYLGGRWYECTRPRDSSGDTIASLDVSVLQERLLGPVLAITDPRGDARLQYLGGARPLSDLEAAVDRGDFAAACAMQPVDVETVLAIADEGRVMPPKSTWFEPKLLSGLLIHCLD